MRGFIIFAALCLGVVAIIEGAARVALQPQDFPWTELDLGDPIGAYTGPKLAALTDEPRQCRSLLRSAGSGDQRVPPLNAAPPCGFGDGMRLLPAHDHSVAWRPAGPVTSCPVAAALAIWEREVVQPAAERHFAQRVTAIDHAGSYSCRRIYGRSEGRYSEHATADAFDILGFRLEDEIAISVLRDWSAEGAKADFLRDVRDGACGLFSTVLSPDYNAAHANHLHFDQAERGAWGGRLCR